MSNYPDNIQCRRQTMAEMQCKCGHKWEADGYTEFGRFDLNHEEDAICSECGAWSDEA